MTAPVRRRLRLPIRLKLAVVSAGAHLRDPAACSRSWSAPSPSSAPHELRRRPARHRRRPPGRIRMEPRRCDPAARLERPRSSLQAGAAGGAVIRVVDRNGGVISSARRAAARRARRGHRATSGDFRVVSRPLRGARPGRRRLRQPAPARARRSRWPSCSTPSRRAQRRAHHERACACFLALRRRSAARRWPSSAGLSVARRAMRPIAGLTQAAREVARTRDPARALPKPRPTTRSPTWRTR